MTEAGLPPAAAPASDHVLYAGEADDAVLGLPTSPSTGVEAAASPP